MLTLLLSRLEAGKPVLEEREKTQRLVSPVMRLIVCLCEDSHKINYVSRTGQSLFPPPIYQDQTTRPITKRTLSK